MLRPAATVAPDQEPAQGEMMATRVDRPARHSASCARAPRHSALRRACVWTCLAFAIPVALAGCGGSGATPSGSPVRSVAASVPGSAGESALPQASGSALPSATPGGSLIAVNSLYLRMWFLNPSLGPDNFFFTSTVISNGKLYYQPDKPVDDNPAKLYYPAQAADISPNGIQTVVATAQADGLFGATHDFTCPHDPGAPMMAGKGTTYISIVLNGVAHNLTGACQYEEGIPSPGAPAAGTYRAFVDFGDHLRNMAGWLGSDLGTPAAWAPTSLAVYAATQDAAWWSPGLSPGDTATWVAGTFANFGNKSQPISLRCGVLTGTSLDAQFPAIKAAHEGTVFSDSTGAQRVLAVRVVMPNEPTADFCV